MTSTNTVCPLCGTSNAEIVYDLSSAHSAEDVPGLVARCRSCPMWFKVLADPDGIPKNYPGEFGEDELAQAYLLGGSARTLFRDTLAQLSTAHGAHPRLLDVGAGQGVLVEEALRLGFDAEGLDHCESNVIAAAVKGLKIRHAAAEDLHDRDAFDVITMMDLIEHVRDPLRLLQNAQRALKTDGELIVYTPNHRAAVVVLSKLLHTVGMRGPVREIFGRNHVSFFDDRSLPMALERTGFNVRLQQRFPYDSARPGQYVSPLSLAAVTFVEWLGKPWNRVFRLLVYAQKPRV